MHIRNPMEWVFGQFAAKSPITTATAAEYWPEQRLNLPQVRQISRADVGEALRRGWSDFSAARTDVLFFCLIYPVLALFITAADAWGNILPLLFPTASGFALVGPFFAVGLYEMSRQRERTGKIRWLDSFNILRSPSIGAIAGLGLGLIALFLAWLAVALGIYNATLGPVPPASVLRFLQEMLTTGAGFAMIGFGILAGSVFAVGVLVISVISFPLLLDRPVGLRTAVATSVAAVRQNPGPLALWGVVVAVGLVLGSLPCFIGLIVILPVLGHASWHLYRRIVPD